MKFWLKFLKFKFFFVEPFASRVPYMTTIGNHERDWPNR